MEQLLPPKFRPATWAITELAALNWGLVEFADTNLLTDVLGLSGDPLTVTFGVIGAAGAVGLYNTAAHYLGD
ncbi:hypothetical protein GRX03_11960 [Halovenus sp. WSH3]|uniref:MFS transporter n=1 Tax=Halovenus carboxidivorans TaxID=2692199 RepID=A0A6B0T2L4_9EURY|nr:hypothetical protein [Halovenus carboxidivorans]MXR52314.1 hypothetical protein [Halovenus carboxidivorans]